MKVSLSLQLKHCTIENLWMTWNGLTILHEGCPHGIVTCNYMSLTDLFFQDIKFLLFLACPLEDLFHTSQCMQMSCDRRKFSNKIPPILGCSQKTSYSNDILGIGQFIMISTLEGSIFNTPPPKICLKHIKEVLLNSHFDILKNNL